MDLLYLQDRTDQRQTLVAAIAQTWAQAGEIDRAIELAAQVPDRLLVRAAVLREIAAAQARASNDEKAQAAFDQALRLAYGWKDPLERAQALHSIAQAQAAAGMKAVADITLDRALQAATTRIGSIDDDPQTRARTLLALADLQMRSGSAAEETLDKALAAERDARSSPSRRPSFRQTSIGVTESGSGNVGLLCDIAKAQARAGLTVKAVVSFDEALQAAEAITVVDPARQGEAIAGALATVADAQREGGLREAARATRDRAATVVEAITDDFYRAEALARLAGVRTKAGDADQGFFARALAIARALPGERVRAQALQRIATAQADAGLRDEGARTFAEAVRHARVADEQILSGNAVARFLALAETSRLGQYISLPMLCGIADAQRHAGLIKEAAVTFEEALGAILSSDMRQDTSRLVSLIKLIVDNDSAYGVVGASLALRLVEAAETISERVGRAEMLYAIARALPS